MMEVDAYELLRSNGMLLLFLVIGLGYLIGNIKLGPMPVGPTIGVLLAALVFGHYGFEISPGVGTFGFALFIFSVGLQAGPSFFSAFREDGPKYIGLAFIVAITGFALSVLAAKLLKFDAGFAAGLMAGALTSTPTLVGAQDAVNTGLAMIPPGFDQETVLQNINVAYALTYLIGSVTVILVIGYVPKLLKLNLDAMARTYAKEKGMLAEKRSQGSTADTLPLVRAYKVREQGAGKTLAQRGAELNIPAVALRVKRGNDLHDVTPEMILELGDIISVIASLKTHKVMREKAGIEEVLDPDVLDYHINARDIVVLSPEVVGKRLSELDLPKNYGCFAAGLTRTGVELPLSDEVVLLKGDRLHIVGEEAKLSELGRRLGYVEEEVEETDLVTFSFGIVFGILLGLVVIKIAGITIGLGTAGGLLIAGVAIGYVSSIYPTFGRVPAPARFLLRELGLMLLMASIGLNAGSGIVEGLFSVGPAIILAALMIAIGPLSVGYFLGRRVLKMNPVLLLGALTGAMTSTPALDVVSKTANSSIPAIGYAGSYTFSNVLLTFCGTIMMVI
ncbi:MAG: TrkA C-terminal domain-containing protein [Gammaproteobacteria bacterium]|jgi:putative transport protein